MNGWSRRLRQGEVEGTQNAGEEEAAYFHPHTNPLGADQPGRSWSAKGWGCCLRHHSAAPGRIPETWPAGCGSLSPRYPCKPEAASIHTVNIAHHNGALGQVM